MATQPETLQEAASLKRTEWLAYIALIVSLGGGIYIVGVDVQRLNDYDRRIAAMETYQGTSSGKIETLLVTTARIDANVASLTDEQHTHRGGGQ